MISTAQWIDVSVPIYEGMVSWPDNPPVRIRRAQALSRGDEQTVSEISMSSHSGTHMDAPMHFVEGGKSIDEMPLEIAVSRARIIDIRDEESVKPDELADHHIEPGECILLKTRNSPRAWQTEEFIEDFVYISEEAAEYLVEHGVRAVGIDYLSVGSPQTGEAVHNILLRGGVWTIEGLNLAAAEAGLCIMVCLPLKIRGCDGAPARVILQPLQ